MRPLHKSLGFCFPPPPSCFCFASTGPHKMGDYPEQLCCSRRRPSRCCRRGRCEHGKRSRGREGRRQTNSKAGESRWKRAGRGVGGARAERAKRVEKEGRLRQKGRAASPDEVAQDQEKGVEVNCRKDRHRQAQPRPLADSRNKRNQNYKIDEAALRELVTSISDDL